MTGAPRDLGQTTAQGVVDQRRGADRPEIALRQQGFAVDPQGLWTGRINGQRRRPPCARPADDRLKDMVVGGFQPTGDRGPDAATADQVDRRLQRLSS
jgi:hypothetical protein